MDTMGLIKQQITNNKVILYIKGTPQFPMCGFSAEVVQTLSLLNTSYAYVNVLENPAIRSELPKYANWPTFPQLYINGELIGGCDIVKELNDNNQLKPLLEEVGALGEGKIVVA